MIYYIITYYYIIPISHTSIQHMGYVDIFNISLDLFTISLDVFTISLDLFTIYLHALVAVELLLCLVVTLS